MEKAKGGWGWGGEAAAAAAAAENPAMTAATREQHAKPWKSFPASSKTFMEFSQHIQHHGGGRILSLPFALTLPPLFYYIQPLFLGRLDRGKQDTVSGLLSCSCYRDIKS